MGALVCPFLNRKIREDVMSLLNRMLFALGITSVVVGGIFVTKAYAQSDPNSAPNPYRTVENWAKLPDGRTWGQVISADIDGDGKSIWVVERCGGTSCAKSDLASVLKFDSSGNLVKSFGAGMIVRPHGLFIDKNNDVWVTDGDAENGKGDQVFEFSQDGKVLLTLGKAGIAGDGPDTFNKPSDVLVAPNGDIFVADGHGPGSNARIVKFSADGTFIKAWGKEGTAPGEFNNPHSLATPWRWIPKAVCSWPTAGTAASRFSIRTENF